MRVADGTGAARARVEEMEYNARTEKEEDDPVQGRGRPIGL